ncbi:hypothetical protein D3C71_1558160 [compost metagenome]
MLGRHISRLLCRTHQAMYGGHVDDAAPALAVVGRLHGRQHQAGGVEGAGQIDGNHRIPALGREVLDRRDMLDAGIVHQDVDLAEVAHAVIDHIFDIGHARHIGAVVGHLGAQGPARGLDLGARSFDIAKTVEHDVRALLCQGLGNAKAYAAGGSSDESSFAFQHWEVSE